MRTSGVFMFVFVAFEASLLRMYPAARCPTANDFLSSLF
jgi:hypothetical protein